MCIDPASLAAMAGASGASAGGASLLSTLAPLAATVGGSLLQANAMESAQRRQDAAANAALAVQDQARRTNQRTLMDTAQQYDATSREQALQAAQQTAGDRLTSAVTSNPAPQFQNPAVAGTVSNSFTAAQGQRLLDSMKRAAAQAQLMGKTAGFSDLRLTEGANDANAGVQQALTSAVARSKWEGAQPGISAAGRVSQAPMILGGVLSTVGTNALGNRLAGLFAPAGAPTTGDFSRFDRGQAMDPRAPARMRLFPTG